MYKYIYPPRIETKLPLTSLNSFDHMDRFLAQVKLNGSSMQVYTNGKEVHTYNRHKEKMICKIASEELAALNPYNDWMVLCGEYMNKNKRDEDNKHWNLKYVIWDILVLNGKHLLNTTFEERQQILKNMYPDNPVKKYMHQISDNCFRVESIETRFVDVYSDVTQYDMYEGVVLKDKGNKLSNGTTKNNNSRAQFKVRKPTKNYNF